MERNNYNYRIRTAEPSELLLLRKIEDDASSRFLGLGLIEDESTDSSFPLDELARLIEKRQAWVACLADNVPVGMILASERDGSAYVEELDVLPDHGQRGVGSLLLEHACSWAKENDYRAIALSTFSTVPWNAPFYRKRGFRDLAVEDWSASMPEIRRRELELGLKADARVFMRREL